VQATQLVLAVQASLVYPFGLERGHSLLALSDQVIPLAKGDGPD